MKKLSFGKVLSYLTTFPLAAGQESHSSPSLNNMLYLIFYTALHNHTQIKQYQTTMFHVTIANSKGYTWLSWPFIHPELWKFYLYNSFILHIPILFSLYNPWRRSETCHILWGAWEGAMRRVRLFSIKNLDLSQVPGLPIDYDMNLEILFSLKPNFLFCKCEC